MIIFFRSKVCLRWTSKQFLGFYLLKFWVKRIKKDENLPFDVQFFFSLLITKYIFFAQVIFFCAERHKIFRALLAEFLLKKNILKSLLSCLLTCYFSFFSTSYKIILYNPTMRAPSALLVRSWMLIIIFTISFWHINVLCIPKRIG